MATPIRSSAWLVIGDVLIKQGEPDLAAHVLRFVDNAYGIVQKNAS
jgi:hypothetical protein